MRRLVQFLLSALVSAVIIWTLMRHFDAQQTLTFVLGASPAPLVLGVSLMVLAYAVRAARWPIWERGLSYRNSLRLLLIGFMGNNLLPARLGEILRAHCAATRTGSDRRRTAALGSIAAERVLDGVLLATLGVASVFLVTVNGRLAWLLVTVSVCLGTLGVLLALALRYHTRLRQWVDAGHRKFPGHLPSYGREKVHQFIDGFLPLGTPARILAALTATAVIWSMELASYYFIGSAVWPAMTVQAALLMVVVVNFASLVPVTLGGIGSIEATAPLFLIAVGVPAAPALAVVVVQHASQYLFTTISGGAVYVAGEFYRIPIRHRAPRPSDGGVSLRSRSLLADTRSSLDRFGLSLEPASRGTIQLSIIIPAYNEQARLPRTVLETLRWCTSHQVAFEIIVVDDGSRDETLSLARLFEESDARVRALACPHMGKGAAVRMGMLNAKGEAVLFMDADGATPLDEIPKLAEAIGRGHDVAIGSRVAQTSDDEVVVVASRRRHFIGRVFALFVNVIAVEGIGDTQCGFKMFRRRAAEAVFSRQKLVGFAFDVEILMIAKRLGLSIAEVPVNWVAQEGSKVNVITDSARMLRDIVHIRWLHRDLMWDRSEQAAGTAT